MPVPNAINPLARAKEDYFTLTVKPGILGESLTYSFTEYKLTNGYCNVDWGDGSYTETTDVQATLSHTYSAAGTYKIKIKADCYKFIFGQVSTVAPLIYDSNGNWDALGDLKNASGMFDGCSNAIFSFTQLPSRLNAASTMFRNCTNARLRLTSLPDGIPNGTSMFDGCSKSQFTFTTLPSSLTNGTAMFRNCANATLPLTELSPGLTSCINMFNGCVKATMDISTLAQNGPSNGWTGVTNINSMFLNCSLVTGSRSEFLAKFPNVTNTTNAFNGTNTTA